MSITGRLIRASAALFERRALSGDPVFLKWLGGGSESYSGKTVNETTALEFLPVYAANLILSESVGQLPFGLFRIGDDGGSEPARNHPLNGVLHDSANEDMTAIEFRTVMQGHLGTWGNAYAVIGVNGQQRVNALEPLDPSQMDVRRVGKSQVIYRHLGDGREWAKHQIFHLRGFGFDGLKGYSPVTMARHAIGRGMAIDQFGSNFFRNDGIPAGVLMHPGDVGKQARENIKESWKDLLANRRGTPLLEGGLKYQQIGIPPEDGQFLETAKLSVTDIARLYRIPPHMLGDLERATFSNIEQQGLEFVSHTLMPWLVRWEQAVKMRLLRFDERPLYRVKFNVTAFLRGDAAARAKFYDSGRMGGWLSPDDIRRLEDQNPLPKGAGEDYSMPLNWGPLGAEPEEKPQRAARQD